MRKLAPALVAAICLGVVGYAQQRRADGHIHVGSKNTDYVVEGNLYSASPDGGLSLTSAGVTLPSRQAGSCTLASGTPSRCSATVHKTAPKCTCAPVGDTAAIAAAGCAVTTDGGAGIYITGPNSVTTVMNYFCW
jgi:hypothetical protein